ncbi:MAG: RagB/SusD family nutrient uptake outer membrane protein [Bacteroidales bacterium]
MKEKVIISVLTAALVTLTACEKFLVQGPSQSVSEDIALSTDANVKSVLQGAYSLFNEPWIYGGNILRNGELLAGNGEINWVNRESYYEPYQFFTKSIQATNSEVLAHWSASYKVINSVNNVLSAIDVVKDADRNWVKGEALFLRALAYFDLVRFFALPYEAGTVNNHYGVPLILKPTRFIGEDVYVGRNSVEEVYDRIVTDLVEAAEILPEENDIYATSGAANALLARVYLQKGQFDNARKMANAVISSGVYSLETVYANTFNRDEPSQEDIFVAKITYPQEYNSMTISFSSSEYGGYGDIEILDGHLKLYPEGDRRTNLFFMGDGLIRCGKWNNLWGCVNLIRLAEMYLIRAECNIRLGIPYTGADPVDDYNVIHTRAGLPPVSSIALDDILFERRLELAFEGHRIHDIKRLKQSIGIWAYNNPRLVFPIPARELETNPVLQSQQNPGY